MPKYLIKMGYFAPKLYEVVSETEKTYSAFGSNYRGEIDRESGVDRIRKSDVLHETESFEAAQKIIAAAKAVENHHKPIIDDLHDKWRAAQKALVDERDAVLRGGFSLRQPVAVRS